MPFGIIKFQLLGECDGLRTSSSLHHFSTPGGAGQGVRVDCDRLAPDSVRMGAGSHRRTRDLQSAIRLGIRDQGAVALPSLGCFRYHGGKGGARRPGVL